MRELGKVSMTYQMKPFGEVNKCTYFCDVVFSAKPNTRAKRAFKFHEKGKFQQIAQKIRAKVGRIFDITKQRNETTKRKQQNNGIRTAKQETKERNTFPRSVVQFFVSQFRFIILLLHLVV